MVDMLRHPCRIPPKEYLGKGFAFEPLTWKPGMKLVPGSVVRLQHEDTERSQYVFECTRGRGGVTDGLLTVVRGSSVTIDSQPAKINLAHPSKAVARSYMPFVEFTFTVGETRTRIPTGFDSAEVLNPNNNLGNNSELEFSMRLH